MLFSSLNKQTYILKALFSSSITLLEPIFALKIKLISALASVIDKRHIKFINYFVSISNLKLESL